MFLTIDDVTSVQYRVKRFISSRSKDYTKALSIYASNTAPALKTNTNEITHWLDNAYSLKKDREFHALGFYKNNDIIGYAQFMYLSNKRVIIIDYMAIEESERKLGAFFQFIDLIKDYIENSRIDFDYILTEVGYLTNSVLPSDFSRSLIKLVKIVGFGIVQAEYHQPQLSPENSESKMIAQLMVYSKPSLGQIKRDTYLSWVNSIYFDHYIEWYKPFMTEKEIDCYINDITSLFNKIKSKSPYNVKIMQSTSDLVINNNTRNKKPIKVPALIKVSGILLCSVLFISSFIAIWKHTKISIIWLLIIYVVFLFLVLTIYSIFNAKAKRPANSLIEIIKLLFDKSR